MQLPQEKFKEFHTALLSAFPTYDSLFQLTYFEMGVNLDVEVGTRFTPTTVLAQELILWADRRGRVEELLVKAYNSNRGNHKLKAFFAEASATLAPEPGGELEAVVLRTVIFNNVAEWQSRSEACARVVCRIAISSGAEKTEYGTGFLVKADVVMTNYHVVRAICDNGALHAGAQILFGYATDKDGVVTYPGDDYGLADDWLIQSSPVGELDYALIRLSRPAGEEESGERAGVRRGWLPLSPTPIESKSPLLILQHPQSTSLKITGGAVTGSTANRVCYNANTLGGSSGAPAFDFNWNLVALHQKGDEATGNYGVPVSLITPHLPAGF